MNDSSRLEGVIERSQHALGPKNCMSHSRQWAMSGGRSSSVCSAVYSGGLSATPARACLRRRFSAADYRNLIVFTAYNKMCHEWMAAHPEVSYEVDQRDLQNYAPIAAEAPAIADFITGGAVPPVRSALELEEVAMSSRISTLQSRPRRSASLRVRTSRKSYAARPTSLESSWRSSAMTSEIR